MNLSKDLEKGSRNRGPFPHSHEETYKKYENINYNSHKFIKYLDIRRNSFVDCSKKR
jgi:hypothetical protein